jgi:bifunctional non-homologous end joining protein LigD
MVDELSTLVWMAGHGAIELHTPQWKVVPDTDRDDARGPVDRLVIDLDPGDGATLADCAQVALWVREHLSAAGLPSVPVTSGSKGMQVYAPWPADASMASVELARELAEGAERAFPGRVVSRMTKAIRDGRVLLDWSQNNPAKTTVCPYSLRARSRPTVACPRWWDEIDDAALAHVEVAAMPDRFADGDPMSALIDTAL